MNANAQKKMCWNCDGNVQLEQDVCPYCQTTLDGMVGGMTDGSMLYPNSRTQSKVIPATTFGPLINEEEEQAEEATSDANECSLASMTGSLALMMSGIILFIFSTALCLFSHNGKLTLQWNSDYWLVYGAFACGLLYIGIRSMQRLENDD